LAIVIKFCKKIKGTLGNGSIGPHVISAGDLAARDVVVLSATVMIPDLDRVNIVTQ